MRMFLAARSPCMIRRDSRYCMLEMFNTTWLFEMSRGLNVNFFTFGDMVTPPQKHPLVQLCIHEAVEVVNNLRPPQMEKRPWNLKFFITRSGGICKESSQYLISPWGQYSRRSHSSRSSMLESQDPIRLTRFRWGSRFVMIFISSMSEEN